MASRRGRATTTDEGATPAKLNKEAWRKTTRLFRYLKPHMGAFALGLFCLLITSLLSLAFPLLLGKLVNASVSDGFWSAPLTDLTNIDSIAKLLILVFAFQAAFGFVRIYLFGLVSENALADLRQDTYSHLVRMPMLFFAQRRVGELNSRISADVALLQEGMTTSLAELLRQVVTISLGITLLTFVSVQLTLTMLATLPVVALIAVFFGRYIRKLSTQVQDRIADTNVIVDETLQGIQNVKAFSNEAFEVARYRSSVLKARDLALKGVKWRGSFVSFIIFCMFGVVVFIIWRAVHLMADDLLDIGDITAFLGLSIMIGASIASVPDLITTMLKAVGATERLMDLQEGQTEAIDLTPRKEQLKLTGDIAFEHVSFHYATRPEHEVLRDVVFHAKPGERVALVGPSGAGKSTIASLVLRFYDPVGGRITIDGKDSRDYNLGALRDRMSIVPQEVLLFGGTILENIAYGRPGASREDIEAAARKANAHDFITSFPEGYATIVGERGIQLSGGQRQRIAIARAVLKDPAILILDEATSALDTASERLVQDALDKLMLGRTSIVIAHRLSTVRNADRILVLDHGMVTASGTHDDLIADTGGLYYSLSKMQLSPETTA
ncbi:MAG TPA: ABC transporter transmembrane domain-containing protein [Flavobacteriales bacterium]|nr:ATP-binding cassette domain-containing protein [Flavobacteriales bacterium]QQS72563.1 MAG: ATP-binding cassette domain-containing protein [Flavobacteriales bacterium]HQV39833.1 ABC transporter transmembrane domain-containing protein [Flavobacteriales bacterium]HQW33249.1 ABC transporter transmembrane domain-containing protein [Flavobacteriales bacterium]HQY03933.1 ABC transporter transmembrane domain-containing protein [Flavobacteriales bacterium]